MAALLGPYMPNTSRELRAQLGMDKVSYGYIPDTVTQFLPQGHKIGKPSPIFGKIDDKQVDLLRNKYAGRQETPPRDNKTVSDKGDGSVASLEAAVAKQVEFLSFMG